MRLLWATKARVAPQVTGCEDKFCRRALIPRPYYLKKIGAVMELSGFQDALPYLRLEVGFLASFLNPLASDIEEIASLLFQWQWSEGTKTFT